MQNPARNFVHYLSNRPLGSRWLSIIPIVSGGQIKRVGGKTKAPSREKRGAKVNASLHVLLSNLFL
jgi:hypothetical protein